MINYRPVRKSLTPRQSEALTAFKQHVLVHEYSPSLGEVAVILGISKPAAHELLRKLERKGYLIRTSNGGHRPHVLAADLC